jgi:single-stranded-DNA-specific exonuclease
MNMAAVEKFAKEGINLIVTVDCGSTNVAEVEFARKKDIDVVITDHHLVLNEHDFAFALINPRRKDDQYPFKELSGTAVAFKLVQVLFAEARKAGNSIQKGEEKWMLDLVAIATVTDVMPLLDENRTLVKYGLLVLQRTRRPGLRALIKKSRADVYKTDANTLLGFILGPRLNSAGRVHHANMAFDLLNAKDMQTADKQADKLEQLNSERRVMVSAILQDLERNDFVGKHAIVCGRENWPVGVLGIAAGHLVDKYNKPVFLYQKKQYTLVGSARTPQNFNTVIILAEAGTYLQKFGGHAQAGGFTAELQHEANFANAISASAQKYAEAIGADKLCPTLNIDSEVAFKDITHDLYKDIQKISPFGEANPNPTLVLRNAYITNPQMVGSQKNHFRCYAADGPNNSRSIKAIGFAFEAAAIFKEGDRADFVFNLDIDEWNGNSELVLKLLDVAKN